MLKRTQINQGTERNVVSCQCCQGYGTARRAYPARHGALQLAWPDEVALPSALPDNGKHFPGFSSVA